MMTLAAKKISLSRTESCRRLEKGGEDGDKSFMGGEEGEKNVGGKGEGCQEDGLTKILESRKG